MPTPDIRVSVVVPTCIRADRMVRLIDALAAQDITEPFEVVVADDRSTDDTLQRLEALSTGYNHGHDRAAGDRA